MAQHDSCPVMYLAHPELFEGRTAGVFVETQGAVTLGKTVTDLQSDKKFGVQNALVLLHLDREKFMQILKDCIRTLPWRKEIPARCVCSGRGLFFSLTSRPGFRA